MSHVIEIVGEISEFRYVGYQVSPGLWQFTEFYRPLEFSGSDCPWRLVGVQRTEGATFEDACRAWSLWPYTPEDSYALTQEAEYALPF